MRKTLLAPVFIASALLAQTVEGTVTSTTGAALPGVSVTLMKGDGRNEVTGYSTVTDASGVFRLRDVKDGVYVVNPRLAGFLSPIPGGPGNRPFAVTGGVPTQRLRLEMMPEGRVSGRVVDGRGAPVPGSMVELTAPYRRTFEQDTSGIDGSFAFEHVGPGNYTLLAVAPLSWKPPAPVDGQEFAWLPTFFGGVSFREGAASILIGPGGNTSGQDVKLLAAAVHHLRGIVLDPAADAAPGVKVELWDTGNREDARSTVSKSDGSFEFAVTDRQWRLSAEVGSDTAKLAGSLSVQMAGQDLDDVVVPLTAPFSVHGSIRFDPPDGGKLPVGILFMPENGAGLPSVGEVENSGKFTVDGLYAGVYGITFPAFSAPGYYLDAIRIGDRDVLTREVEIVSEYTPISFRFKAGGGTVRGSVEDCGAATVLLLPQDRAMRRQGIVRQAQCSEGDHFEIAWVRPGDYYLFAFAPGSSAVIPPYDLDQEYLNRAVKLTVAGGSASQVDLKVIPPRGF
jgi:hypothetical protein